MCVRCNVFCPPRCPRGGHASPPELEINRKEASPVLRYASVSQVRAKRLPGLRPLVGEGR